MGKMDPPMIKIESGSTKRLPAAYGLGDFEDMIAQNTDSSMDWEPLRIYHTKGKRKYPIDIKIGKGHPPPVKNALRELFTRYSEIFFRR